MEIKEYKKIKRIEKVIHFLKTNGLFLQKNSKVYLLKTVNEKSDGQIKEKLIGMLNSKNKLSLAFMRTENTFNLDKVDSEGIAYVFGKEFYDLYLITNLFGKYYYMLIQENNFFENGANFELVTLKEIDAFNYKLYFLNRKSLN